MAEITKAIIPVAGRGTRFLPLSKVVPKEFFPLGYVPLVSYAVAEAKAAGACEIIFVCSTNHKLIEEYFRRTPKIEALLQERKEKRLLEDLASLEELADGLSFSTVTDKPFGDGHAILQARKLIGEDPCFVLYPDDVIEAKVPCALQLAQAFRTSKRPVIGLFELPKDRLSSYGVVDSERLARRLHKIKKIVQKPDPGQEPSSLALAGRSILTPEVFAYLRKQKANKNGEISLTETFAEIVKAGKIIYGVECEGRWWECGSKEAWMKSFLYFALSNPDYGKELQKFIKEEKLI
ncbi:MAG: sugar phosphate nucleotidyltransferase [Candidatus Yanofskybacteria bacterium]|nr:sugar phosphate nucleotidyltransferase [Candidatus Yanofskybacteria bacterium]